MIQSRHNFLITSGPFKRIFSSLSQIVNAEAIVFEGLNSSVTALPKVINPATGFGRGLQPTAFPPIGVVVGVLLRETGGKKILRNK